MGYNIIFCKHVSGQTPYLLDEIEYNSSNSSLTVKHALYDKSYVISKSNIELLEWDGEFLEPYRNKILISNPSLRRIYMTGWAPANGWRFHHSYNDSIIAVKNNEIVLTSGIISPFSGTIGDTLERFDVNSFNKMSIQQLEKLNGLNAFTIDIVDNIRKSLLIPQSAFIFQHINHHYFHVLDGRRNSPKLIESIKKIGIVESLKCIQEEVILINNHGKNSYINGPIEAKDWQFVAVTQLILNRLSNIQLRSAIDSGLLRYSVGKYAEDTDFTLDPEIQVETKQSNTTKKENTMKNNLDKMLPLMLMSGNNMFGNMSQGSMNPLMMMAMMGKSDNMFGGLELDFGKYEGGCLALSFDGKPVMHKGSGNYVSYDKETNKIMDVGDIKFDIPFYKIPVQELSEGDLILTSDQKILIVHSLDTDIICIDPVSGNKETKIERTNIFNMYFYTKLVSVMDLMGSLPGGNQTGFNPMMLMFMSDDDGSKDDSSSMMRMMLMSQMMQSNTTSAPLQTAAPKKAAKKAVNRRSK